MATHTLPPPGTRRGGIATGCPTAHPSRRDLISAAGFTALAGIAAVAIAKPDAEAVEVLPTAHGADARLIALHDQFMVLQVEIDAINAHKRTVTDDEMDSIVCEQADLLEEMHSLVVTTPEGHLARARVFVAWYAIEEDKRSDSEIDHDRLWPILRDLIGGLG